MLDELYDILARDKILGCFKVNMPTGVIGISETRMIAFETQRLEVITSSIEDAAKELLERAYRVGFDVVGIYDVELIKGATDSILIKYVPVNVNVMLK